jgi:amidohydrolase
MSAIRYTEILELAEKHFDQLVAFRRHLHQHPELSFKEFQTTAFIQDALSKAGIGFQAGVAGTGILAEIEGVNAGRTVALRGDMDALPIQEENTCDYRSVNQGVMHACGHDVHSTCLYGAAIIIQSLRNRINGKVQLVFQPGEEKLPGGAKLMLEAGLFKEKKPDALFALHVLPSMPSGKLGFRPGLYMASADELYFTVKGKGGHAAMPHQVNDPVVAAAQFITALQTIASRLAPPGIPTVLSIGKVVAQGATNVIPEKVELEGTFRTMDEAWRAKAHEHIHKIAKNCGEMCGVSIDVRIEKGYPVLVNHPEITEKASRIAADLLGDTNVQQLEMRMTSEDFAWFAQEVPACFFRLGTAGADGEFTSGLHTATFDIDERALVTGTAAMAAMALGFLRD